MVRFEFMKCVILAAGRGTRMGELCDDCPKPMLPIKGRPKLAYTLDALPDEIDEVIFVVGYLGEQIEAYFGDEHMGRKITYIEQDELNGTAGAVALVAPLVDGESFLVLMGDDLYKQEDLEKMIEHEFAILGYQTNHAENFGLIERHDDGTLRGVTERPHGHSVGLANTGSYVLTSEYFDFPQVPAGPESEEFGLPQTLCAAYPEIETHVVTTDVWFPIGNPEALATAQEIIHDFL